MHLLLYMEKMKTYKILTKNNIKKNNNNNQEVDEIYWKMRSTIAANTRYLSNT